MCFVSQLGIWGWDPDRNDPTLFPPYAPVGSFQDTPSGVSGPAVTSALPIWPHSPLILAWGNTAPYLGHQMSVLLHNAHPMSGGHLSGWYLCLNFLLGLQRFLAKTYRCRATDVGNFNLSGKKQLCHGHANAMSSRLQHLWVFVLKDGMLTFTLKPIPVHPDWLLSWDALIKFECWELCLLHWSKLLPPDEGDPPEESLGTLGDACCPCLLLLLPTCWVEHFVNHVHAHYHLHSFVGLHQRLLPILTSILLCHMLQWESWRALFFPRDILVHSL